MDELGKCLFEIAIAFVGLVLSVAGMVWAGDFRWLTSFFAKGEPRRVELIEHPRAVRPRLRYAHAIAGSEPEVLEAELVD